MNISVTISNEPCFWGDKRYHSINYHLRQQFGGKIYKISLDAGFTCPNRDGSLAVGGCAFCSPHGSGDFVAARNKSLAEQFEQGREVMQQKWIGQQYIAYLQAFSNTYAPIARLRQVYETALAQLGVVGLAIATRPDCLPEEVLDLLGEINQQHYLSVELGLQTLHQRTSELLNLHYNYQDFLTAVQELRARNIDICAHVILGLPGEDLTDMMATAQALAMLPVQGIKIQLLHLMRNTPLADIYAKEPFPFLSQAEYVRCVVKIIEILPPDMVIHRLTGDSPRQLLIGPTWSLNKRAVLNAIDKELLIQNSWQGKFYP